MKKRYKTALSIFAVIICIMIIVNPKKYLNTTIDGVKIWALTVLPSMLPFFFFTTLLTKLGEVKRFSKLFSPLTKLWKSPYVTAYPFLMSAISGYPVGVKVLQELYDEKELSARSVERATTFCSTSGPLFVIGAVGVGFLSSAKIGYIVFISHIISDIICGIIYNFGRNYENGFTPVLDNKSSENVLYDCAYSTVISVLIVGVFIVVFYVLAEIISDLRLLYPIAHILSKFGVDKGITVGYLSGLLECTTGCKKLALYPISVSAPLCCSIISFGGISVICQSTVFIKKTGASIKPFIISKMFQAILSPVICLILLRIFSLI